MIGRMRYPTPALPSSLVQALVEFANRNPYVREWAVYPDVSERMDNEMPDCVGMSEAFVRFLRERGFRAEVIEADESPDPWVDFHRWPRVWVKDQAFNIDWVARQYHNLDPGDYPGHDLDGLPCPLIWTGDSPAHPVVKFTVQKTVELDAPQVKPQPPDAPSVGL